MTSEVKDQLTRDHVAVSDSFAARRYFRKFERITGHLVRVAALMEQDRSLSKQDVALLGGYIQALAGTFRALSMKYLMTGHAGVERLEFDARESGFPVSSEVLRMASDAQQAERHLRNMPGEAALKSDMVQEIIGNLSVPARLQFALAQRKYYQELQSGDLFWARNDPETIWQGNEGKRRRFTLHWAVYDSQVNLPVIYLMDLEDSGKTALPKDSTRWPEVQQHLMGQSLGGLKLLTIAQGFDRDFDALHPKRLRRFHLGPMYSSAFTRQSGPLQQVLTESHAPEGEDWALAWTMEELLSDRVEHEKSGWFGTVEREIYALDPFSGRGVDTGTTRTERAVILPERPYQALAESNPPGFREVRKFVVGAGGRVISYR
jgi:hypothetical protein